VCCYVQSFVSFEKQGVEGSAADDAPSYPVYHADSPVSATQNVVQRSDADKNGGSSWGLLQTIGSIISHSLYW